jgi:hypothetical protein
MYRATQLESERGGPDATVDRFIALHRGLFSSALGALDAETERMAALIRAAAPSLHAQSLERDGARVKAWTRAEFRTSMSTPFDTLAILSAWILREDIPLHGLGERWRGAQRKLRAADTPSDGALVAAFVVASTQGSFDVRAPLVGRAHAIESALGAEDPRHRTAWGLALAAMLALRDDAPEALAQWVREATEQFALRTRGRGEFIDEAVQLACGSGMSVDEAVERMMVLRSGPLLPLEPLELGALCRVPLPTDQINARLRHLTQRLAPFAVRGRHEAIRMAVAATLMSDADARTRIAADLVTYVRITERRLARARRYRFGAPAPAKTPRLGNRGRTRAA